MSQVYNAWGFRVNPFAPTPLPATDEGVALLVGREKDVEQIQVRISSPPKLVTVEGRNGIGKTSVINIAAFKAHRAFLASPASVPLVIPSEQAFQINPEIDVDAFVSKIFHAVIVCLKSHEAVLTRHGMNCSKLDVLHKWVTQPLMASKSGGASFAGFGASAGGSQSANTSSGFSATGFEQQTRQLLQDFFPEEKGGGVVCVIDNLELMKTSKAARDLVEALRDKLFNVIGLRWVLSGATGIVRGIGATARLSGYLHDPVEIGEIDPSLASDILTRRVRTFAVSETATLPLGKEDFQRLFEILSGNIRDALSEADNFCTDVYTAKSWKPGQAPDAQLFRQWLKAQCSKRRSSCERVVTERPWQLFDGIIQAGGTCAPGEYDMFGFDTPQAMRANVLKLEEANLIQSLRDEDDNRRKTILVTSNGWMVHFARSRGIDSLFEPATYIPDEAESS